MNIETNRMILREMTPADYDALYAVLADADIMKLVFPDPGARNRSLPFGRLINRLSSSR